MKKIALLTGTPRLKGADDGPVDLGRIEYDTDSQGFHFFPIDEFSKWDCDLGYNSLGLQERKLGGDLGFRITSVSGYVMVTFTDRNQDFEQDFLLTPDSIQGYRELFI